MTEEKKEARIFFFKKKNNNNNNKGKGKGKQIKTNTFFFKPVEKLKYIIKSSQWETHLNIQQFNKAICKHLNP